MISIGVEANGPIQTETVREISFYKGFLAVTNIILAFGMSLIQKFTPL